MNEDIDTDFSRTAREHAISAVKKKYGEKSIAGIMTKGKLLEKNALIYSLKLYGLEKKGDIKGYYDIGYQLKDKFEEFSQSEGWKNLAEGESKMTEEFAGNEDAIEIYHNAMLLEGHVISYGQHAAGVIAIQNDEIENYIPLMLTKNDDGEDTFVVQADMVQCEANLGFIKFDFLGLKNLNVIKRAKELILKYHNIDIDPYALPFEPEVFELLAAADTDFIFQLESPGMKGMLKQLKPTCFNDIVLAVSVYRPGPMDFIPDIIKAKNEGIESEFVIKFPMLKECLAESYGYPVYQEQVMKIMTICAGFSAGKADEVRRYMSKKKEEKLAHVRPEFVSGCKEKHGISEEDANWLFDQLMPFAKYGFNKSHAAAYSFVSYITAWCKFHYLKEYLCAAMTEQGDKTSQLVMNCRNANIKIYLPSINKSDKMFDLYEDGIIIGLENIKGLNQAAEAIVKERNENGPYSSIVDFATRCFGLIDSRNLAQCILSGACDEFTQNRKESLDFISKYMDIYKIVVEKEKKLSVLKEQEFEDAASEKRRATSVAKLDTELSNLKAQLSEIVDVSDRTELAIEERLSLESNYLGMWVSGNPLEAYDLSNNQYRLISEAKDCLLNNKSENEEQCDVSVLVPGVISNFKKIVTKKGADMCFFDLTDRFGDIISCIVFSKTYDSNKDLLKDGNVIVVNAKPSYDIKDEETINLTVNGVRYLSKHQKQIVIEVADLCQYAEEIEKTLLLHKSCDGYKTYVHNLQMKELRQLAFRLDEAVIAELQKVGVTAIIH